jgi:photosystem II stability/assembly factor-like uncharacterized protein
MKSSVLKAPLAAACACGMLVGLGGFFTVVNLACAQPWQATTAPVRYWQALAASADGTKLVVAGLAGGYCSPCLAPIYASTDAGVTWTQTTAPGDNWSAVAASADGTKLVAVSAPQWGLNIDGYVGGGFIYSSLDAGATWKQTSAPTNAWSSVASSADGARLVAVSAPRWNWKLQSYVGEGVIYRSVDSGATWTRITAPSNHWTSVACSADGAKWVATAGGHDTLGLIYASTNTGVTWTATTAPSNNWAAVACSADGTRLVALASLSCPLLDGSIYVSSNSGMTWTPTTAPQNDWTAVASSADGTRLFAASVPAAFSVGDCHGNAEGGIYTSVNSGVTWTPTGAPRSWWAAVACSADGYKAVAADRSGLLCTLPYSGLWRLAEASVQRWHAVASSADGTRLVVATEYYGPICVSSNSGATWRETSAPRQEWSSVAASADGTKLVAAVGQVNGVLGAIYRSPDAGATWTPTSARENAWVSVASSTDGEKLVAAALSGDGLIHISGDSGFTWAQTSAPSNSWTSVASSADGTKLVAASSTWHGSGLIYSSTNSGVDWTATTAPANDWTSVSSSIDASKLVAASRVNLHGMGSGDGLIYTSGNSGATWRPTTAPSNNWVAVSSSADGTKLVAAAANRTWDHLDQSCLYTSTDSGATWVRDSPAVISWSALAASADGSSVVAVGSQAIYLLQPSNPAAPLPPSPWLTIDRFGANPGLSWLVPSTRFVLQQSSDLGTADWVDVPTPPTLDLTNLHQRLTLTPSLGSSFYRLKQQ